MLGKYGLHRLHVEADRNGNGGYTYKYEPKLELGQTLQLLNNCSTTSRLPEPDHPSFKMHKSFAYVTLALALLQLTDAAWTPTRVTRSQTKQRVAQNDNSAAAPSPRLRQTNWNDIKARQELRMSPLYRRQQASAVPSVTCPATYNPTYAVARYPNVDILGGDVSVNAIHLVFAFSLTLISSRRADRLLDRFMPLPRMIA